MVCFGGDSRHFPESTTWMPRCLITRAAFSSAFWVCPQRWQTNAACSDRSQLFATRSRSPFGNEPDERCAGPSRRDRTRPRDAPLQTVRIVWVTGTRRLARWLFVRGVTRVLPRSDDARATHSGLTVRTLRTRKPPAATPGRRVGRVPIAAQLPIRNPDSRSCDTRANRRGRRKRTYGPRSWVGRLRSRGGEVGPLAYEVAVARDGHAGLPGSARETGDQGSPPKALRRARRG